MKLTSVHNNPPPKISIHTMQPKPPSTSRFPSISEFLVSEDNNPP